MEDKYRKCLTNTVRSLENTLDELSLNIINLAMTGEYSDFDDTCEEGEIMRLHLDDFRNVDDQNIKMSIKLFDQIYESYTSIMNINAIKREEIDAVADDESFDDSNLPF